MTHEQASRLGEFIRTTRLRAGIGLRELARLSDISPANLSKIEAGTIGEPSPRSLQRMARALGADYEDLAMLAGYSLPEGLPTLPVYLRTRYEDLSPEEIRQVDDYVRFLRHQHGQQQGDSSGEASG